MEGEHPSTGAPGILGLLVLVSGTLGVILEGASGLAEWWPGEVSKALECAGFSFHPVPHPPPPTPKRNGTGDLGGGGGRGGNFQGRRPRFLRLFARGCNRALELGEWRQATGMALLSTRVTTRSQSPSGSNRRPSWTLLYTHWKERVTHVTRGPSFPPSSC